MRVSRGVGLPRPLPDVEGLALRLPGLGVGGEPLDLLVNSAWRFAFAPAVLSRTCAPARTATPRPCGADCSGWRSGVGARTLDAMDNLRRPRTRLDVVHRVGAVLFALGLTAFGVLGLLQRLDWFSTRGAPVLGLSTNGLLSVVSLVTAAVLLVGATRSGRTASTVLTVVGAAFLLSGVLNVLLLEGPFNLLAFEMSNVVFSLVAGGLLLVLGSWGRFTGRLPDDNQYAGEHGTVDGGGEPDPVRLTRAGDARAAVELADAERADARRSATPEQAAALRAAGSSRRTEDRVRAWRRAYRTLS